MTFSQDGRFGAVATENSVFLIDTSDWRMRPLPIKAGVTALAFSPDGTELAIARSDCGSRSPIGEPRDRYVQVSIINPARGAVLKTFTESRVAVVHELAFTATGGLVAAAGQFDPDKPREPRILGPNPSVPDDDLLLWNVFTGRMNSILPDSKGRALRGLCWAFSPDGRIAAFSLVTVDKEQTYREEVRIHDTAAGSLAHAVRRDYSGSPSPLAFSSDGRMLFMVSNAFPGLDVTRAYDLARQRLDRRGPDVPVPAGWLAVTDSGRLAVSTGSRNHTTSWTPADIWHESRNGSGRIFVLNTKGVPEIRIDVDKPYMSGRLVPHRDLLALFDGSALTLYDLRTGKAEHSFRMGPPVEITSPADPEPRLPGRGGLSRGRVVSAHRIQALAFLPDRKALASVDDTGTLRLWDVAGSKEVDRKTLADSYPIGLSPSGDVAQPEDPGTMLLSDFIGEAVPNHLKGLAGRPVSLAFSPGGDWLAAGTGDGSIGVWRTRSPDAQFLFTGHKGAVLSLAFSRDAAVLASGGEDETVRLWNLESGQPFRTLKGHSRRVSAVAFGPDGNALASGGEDASVILWDTSKGRVAKRFRDPEGPVLSLCFSPDGSELIGGGNRSLNRWDVKERKLKGVLISGHSYEWAGRRYGPNSGFLESILVMTYSPSGEVLACGCTNNTLLVWDTKTWAGKILRPSAR